MDTSKYAYFILMPKFRNRASTSFRGYQDDDGTIVELFMGQKDPKTGDYLPRYFHFPREKRYIWVRKNEKEIFGRNVYDTLKSHPLCEGSKLQVERGTEPLYKEMNEETDADVAIRFMNKSMPDWAGDHPCGHLLVMAASLCLETNWNIYLPGSAHHDLGFGRCRYSRIRIDEQFHQPIQEEPARLPAAIGSANPANYLLVQGKGTRNFPSRGRIACCRRT